MFTSHRTLTIGWGDCDPANIVYYPNYFAWFNESTVHHFTQAGLPKQALINKYQVVGFPMVETSAKFFAPSTHGDKIRIDTQIIRFGGASFDVTHSIYRDDTLCVRGLEKRVLGKTNEVGVLVPVPIPESVKSLFEHQTGD